MRLRRRIRRTIKKMRRSGRLDWLRNRTHVTEGQTWRQWHSEDWVVVQSKESPQPLQGIYMYGACDVPCLFEMRHHFVEHPHGTVAIYSPGVIAMTRPDILLQTLDGVGDSAVAEEVRQKLALPPGYFKPDLFDPTFTIEVNGKPRTFDKDVIVLTLAASLVRSVLQHKEQGFLVDPGGWWLGRPMEDVKQDDDQVKWLRQNFRSVGRLDVEQFEVLFRRVIQEIQARTNARIVVFNSLTVEPNDPTHDYRLRKRPEGVRRREYLLRLDALSEELGFSVLDIDRLLKEQGIDEAVDFAHFPTGKCGAIAREGYRLVSSFERVG